MAPRLAKQLPSFDELHHMFRLEEPEGVLYWKNPVYPRRIGKKAGYVNAKGYVHVSVRGIGLVLAHRIIMTMRGHVLGPRDDIDHINRIRNDNSVGNLRIVTPSQNILNRPFNRKTKTGIPGVTVFPTPGGKIRYRARIVRNKKNISLGLYDTVEAAANAYKAAADLLNPL